MTIFEKATWPGEGCYEGYPVAVLAYYPAAPDSQMPTVGSFNRLNLFFKSRARRAITELKTCEKKLWSFVVETDEAFEELLETNRLSISKTVFHPLTLSPFYPLTLSQHYVFLTTILRSKKNPLF